MSEKGINLLSETPNISDKKTPERSPSEPKDQGNIWIWTNKYGETRSELKIGYDHGIEHVYQNEYKVDVPSQVLDICRKVEGMGGRALLVGGSVRDTVISAELEGYDLKPKDFDLEIYGLAPATLRQILEDNFENVNKEGAAFAVYKIPVEGLSEPLDTSIPRRESKSGAGHKGFDIEGDPGMSVVEAASRRDLTMNSLAYDPLTETVYDPFGGVEDIRNKTIEVTNVDTFQEDPLRVLRVMQFMARFEFNASAATKNICQTMTERGDLGELPKERTTEEMKKLLTKGIRPSLGFEFAREIGVVEKYWPQLSVLQHVEQSENWHPEGNVWNHTMQVIDSAAIISRRDSLSSEDTLVLTLTALCHDFGKFETTTFEDGRWRAHGHEFAGVAPTKEFLNKFSFSSEIKSQVLGMVPKHLAPKYFWEQEHNEGQNMSKALNRLSHRLAKSGTNIKMLALLAEADQRGRNAEFPIPLSRDQVPDLENWQSWILNKAAELNIKEQAPTRLLNGRDLLENIESPGGQPLKEKLSGPKIGVVLTAVYLDQLDRVVETREDALEKGRHYTQTFGDVVEVMARQRGIPERDIWNELRRLEDPREFLNKAFEKSIATGA